MNRRLHRSLAALRWSLLATLAVGLLGLLAGEAVPPPDRPQAMCSATSMLLRVAFE